MVHTSLKVKSLGTKCLPPNKFHRLTPSKPPPPKKKNNKKTILLVRCWYHLSAHSTYPPPPAATSPLRPTVRHHLRTAGTISLGKIRLRLADLVSLRVDNMDIDITAYIHRKDAKRSFPPLFSREWNGDNVLSIHVQFQWLIVLGAVTKYFILKIANKIYQ